MQLTTLGTGTKIRLRGRFQKLFSFSSAGYLFGLFTGNNWSCSLWKEHELVCRFACSGDMENRALAQEGHSLGVSTQHAESVVRRLSVQLDSTKILGNLLKSYQAFPSGHLSKFQWDQNETYSFVFAEVRSALFGDVSTRQLVSSSPSRSSTWQSLRQALGCPQTVCISTSQPVFCKISFWISRCFGSTCLSAWWDLTQLHRLRTKFAIKAPRSLSTCFRLFFSHSTKRWWTRFVAEDVFRPSATVVKSA